MSETLRNSIDLLLGERIRLIAIIATIEADLRCIKQAQETATSAASSETINRQHRCALASHSRGQTRLREINLAIKAGNIRLQEQIRIGAKRERIAKKQQRQGNHHG